MQKLAEICIKRPVFATMLILALVVLGAASYMKLGVDFFPKVEFPFVTVTTQLPGAAPEEVESQVTKRIEEAVNTISGIDELRSTSSEGNSLVSIQFTLEKDGEVAAQEVRDKVNQVLNQLPRDAKQPVIQKVATDASPVISVVVSSPREIRETTKLVDDLIKKNIESLNGVGEVRFVGDRTRQIQVILDGEKLYSYNLNVDQIRAALAAQNVEVPGGRVDQGAREVSLRTLGRLLRPEEFANIIIGTLNGAPIRVRDVGRIVDGVEEPRSLARLNGVAAVVLEVRKQAGTNTLDVISVIKERIGGLQTSGLIPRDLEINYSRDQSDFIKGAFEAVQAHLVEGGLFAAIVVLLFIRSWRATLIAALAIPTSIISTYTLMYVMGFTLNQISMLALVLMVGIVIDDAIVVLENIFRFQEEKGMGPVEAAIEGTREIGLAVLATTLSLAVVFMPVALMTGIVGRFMSSFGFTAAFAIMVSLLVSFTLTPALSAKFLKTKPNTGHNSTKEGLLFKVVSRPYMGLLDWSMSHRWVIIVISAVVIYTTGPLFMSMGKDFLPVDDQSYFEVTVRTAPGSSLEGTTNAMNSVEGELKKLPGLKYLLTTIGADIQKRVDRGSIIVQLVPPEKREFSQQQLMEKTRAMMKPFSKDMIVGVQLPALISGGASDRDLQYYVQGPDLAQLERYSRAIMTKLAEVPGVADLDMSYEPGKPELRVDINRDKAADLNVSVNSIATALRTLVAGDSQVTTYREGDDRYDVQLRVDKNFRNSPQALNRLFVPSTTLGNVPVSNVASLIDATGPTAIDRYNRQRQIMIQANIAKGGSLSDALAATQKIVNDLNMPPQYATGTVGRSKEFGKAGVSFIGAFLLCFIFMYMILAAQFESFLDPITILLSLPLSVPFALLSLKLANENYNIIYTSVGILVLFGIVKKNSILQVDHIKRLREEGLPRAQAILKGCEDRLRPILMTTAALVAGMLPLAFGGGAGAGTRRTVAIVVIGGQTMCLLLSLLVTPVVYSLFDDMSNWHLFSRLNRIFKRRAAKEVFASLLSLVLFASVGFAAETPARVGVSAGQKKLMLKDAIEMAMQNNLEIQLEKTNTVIARSQYRQTFGVWDFTLGYKPAFNYNVTPTSSVLQAADGRLVDRNFTNNFGATQRLPWNGTRFDAAFNNSRINTTNPFTGLNPYLQSSLSLTLTQPLLRGRKIDNDRNLIRVRRKQVDISDVDYELRVINVVTLVTQAYWDLVAAREDINVQKQSVDLAKDQYERSKRQIDAGTLAPVELSAALAEMERRQDTYYASIGFLTEVENNLKSLLAGGRDQSIWDDEIIPIETRSLAPPAVDDLKTAVRDAIQRRPELKNLRLRLESNEYQKDLARNQLLPAVNLTGGYLSTGLAGVVNNAPNPFTSSGAAQLDRINKLSQLAGLEPLPAAIGSSVPGSFIGGYGTTLNNLFGNNYTSWQAGIQVDWTLRNRAAKENLVQTNLTDRTLVLQRTRSEQQVEAEVRNSLQFLRTAEQRIVAAEASASAAKEKLDSEQRLFETGESTNFLVLTRQNEYADSQRRGLVARLDFNKAIARLEQALGATLETHQISLQ
ncbi:efflux RND transporter permease subunit [Bryobacter aggregatus]|uniref:efflux RND transporter permease subunit n=1 Tax=Bryobacter aggregatus TaxID=360054 RepID=UPI0009B5B9A0|nr:efflux RND transporter permease subunit [Bryobacter aggregatus]